MEFPLWELCDTVTCEVDIFFIVELMIRADYLDWFTHVERAFTENVNLECIVISSIAQLMIV